MKPLTLLLLLFTLTGCVAAAIGGAALVTAVVLHDRRSSGAIIDDNAIEIKSLFKIQDDQAIGEDSHINIESQNGIVLVTGEIPDKALADHITWLIEGVTGVKTVYNELEITTPSSFESRRSDILLKSRVVFALLQIEEHPDFDPSRVKVITENGTVFLMGLIKKMEGDAVADVARRVSNVKSVIKIFEYVD
ncbi:MAG: BON domain-containing protein [Methylococcales bacterium]